MQLMIAGPPGAGKGTQSALLCDHFGLSHLSTGEVLREAVREGTALGRQAEVIMKAGDLVPDDLMLNLVLNWTGTSGQGGFLLDGFPRTIDQARGLEKNGVILDAVIRIHLSDETIISRLSGRRVHVASGRIYHVENHPPRKPDLDDETGEPLVQREDDKPDVVQRRIENYRWQTRPVLAYYQGRGDIPYLSIDGEGQARQVFERILSALKDVYDGAVARA